MNKGKIRQLSREITRSCYVDESPHKGKELFVSDKGPPSAAQANVHANLSAQELKTWQLKR